MERWKQGQRGNAAIRHAIVIRVLGGLMLAVGALMLLPLAVDAAAGRSDAPQFLIAVIVALTGGAALLIVGGDTSARAMTRRQAFAVTGMTWVVTPALAAIPFVTGGHDFADAYFEAASALTTTGATVLTELDEAPRGLLLWRSLLQWLGGVGIVVFGIIIMPFLRVGGAQLFRTENSDTSEKILSREIDIIWSLVATYISLTMFCAVSYYGFGMTAFDAINHAMTTISTGGFSTHDASFGWFNSAPLEMTAVVFMAAGALPFVTYIRLWRGHERAMFSDIQVRAFLFFVLAATLLLAAHITRTDETDFFYALRLAVFHVTSIVTTTGYVTTDYQIWGPFAVGAFFMLTFVGGCSGSTAGGIKIYRFQILRKVAEKHLTRLVSPSRVYALTFGTRRIDEEVEIAILAFLAALLVSLVLFTLSLSWIGLDFVTAVSAAATCLANVGPGLGDLIGPAGTFAPLPDAAKVILSLAMILGRLEFFTLLVMVTPAFWRG